MALDWTREPSRGKHGKYLIHDGIHYNALNLRDNQEQEGKQNKESNNREGRNKSQQRRKKEQDTQIIQNTPLEEDTHEEGDKMRATKDSTQEELHEENDETRTANAPSGRVFWLAHKGQNQRKRKTKIREAQRLVWGRALENKKKADTKARPTEA